MERSEIKEKETQYLVGESKKNPDLFLRETFTDSPDFLEKIGIFFDGIENLPKGYLKLWPQDFIVEEKSINGELKTVTPGNLFDDKKTFFQNDPTIYATLIKCKIPTFEATKDLAEFLEIEPNQIRSAGIKDTDAITSQLISIRGGDYKKLEYAHSPHYLLKNIYSGKGAIEVGSLQGNKFTILIRTNNSFDKEQFKKDLAERQKNGFYNFFYLQRFGTPRLINWFWGLLIFRGDYKNAIYSFLCSEGQREIQYFKNLRNEIKNNLENWEEVEKKLELFPLIMQNELKVIRHLKKNLDDYIGALKQIPDQIKLWIFAYNSLLFNRKLSEYIAEGHTLPEKLPLFLSNDKNDWVPYHDFLKSDGIDSLFPKNIKPFTDIQWKKREIKTKIKAEVYKTKFVPEGVIMSFYLSKGCYATTFLSHFFQLQTGLPPKDISKNIIDTKQLLGEEPITDLIERFKNVTFSKSEDIFGKTE
ncbi:MAG: tRNA pseudouridine(13) synthase TruD [Candidatus Staskawiczbacteria bacterium]|nr:tRNA pseudouridine(13) synthase TruD [Candidatus Staskawiczbacteria bacterium]